MGMALPLAEKSNAIITTSNVAKISSTFVHLEQTATHATRENVE